MSQREDLIVTHSGLAGYVARMYRRHRSVDLRDLEQVAKVALVRAAENWRPEKGASFATYASVCMRREVSEEISRMSRVVSGPTEAARLVLAARYATNNVRSECPGISDAEAEVRVAEVVGVSVSRLRDITALMGGVDAEVPGDDSGRAFHDPNDHAGVTVPVAVDMQRMARSALQGIAATRSARNGRIMRALFVEGKPPIEVAREFGITRERVRQIRDAELPRLKERLNAQFGKKAVADVLA